MGIAKRNGLFVTLMLGMAVIDVVGSVGLRLHDPAFMLGAVGASLAMFVAPGAVLGTIAWWIVAIVRGAERAPDWRWFMVGGTAALGGVLWLV